MNYINALTYNPSLASQQHMLSTNKRAFPYDLDEETLPSFPIKKIKVNPFQHVQVVPAYPIQPNQNIFLQPVQKTFLTQKALIEAYQVAMKEHVKEMLCKDLERDCDLLCRKVLELQRLKQVIQEKKKQMTKQALIKNSPKGTKLNNNMDANLQTIDICEMKKRN